MCIKGRKQTCVVFILDMQNITMRNAFLDFFCLKYNLELIMLFVLCTVSPCLVRFCVVRIWIVQVLKNTPDLHSAYYGFLEYLDHLS